MKLKSFFSLMPLLAAFSVSAAGSVSTVITIKNHIPATATKWSMVATIDQYARMKYKPDTKTFSPNLYTYEVESTFDSSVPSYDIEMTLFDEAFSCVTDNGPSDSTSLVLGTDYDIKMNGTSLTVGDSVQITGLTLDGLSGTTSGLIGVSVQKDLTSFVGTGAYCRGHASFLVEAAI